MCFLCALCGLKFKCPCLPECPHIRLRIILHPEKKKNKKKFVHLWQIIEVQLLKKWDSKEEAF